MAKNIVIQTDGTAVTYSGVKEIETNDPEEGRVTWIPMDETELAIKTVNQNGTYKASSDGYYGYRQFTVSTKNKGKTVGTKPDGRTYAVDTDDDGFLTETLLPDNIRINPQPTKTTYSDGESISLSGAVVKAYSKDDIWEGEGYSGGVIPHSELTLEPSTASGGGGGGEQQTATSDLDTGSFSQPIPLHPNAKWSYTQQNVDVSHYHTYDFPNGRGIVMTSTQSTTVLLGASSEPGVIYRDIAIVVNNETGEISQTVTEYNSSLSYTHNGKTVYYSVGIHGHNLSDVEYSPDVSGYGDSTHRDEAAWTIIYGNISGGGGSESIAVKWNRPEDEEELTTSFDITVS